MPLKIYISRVLNGHDFALNSYSDLNLLEGNDLVDWGMCSKLGVYVRCTGHQTSDAGTPNFVRHAWRTHQLTKRQTHQKLHSLH